MKKKVTTISIMLLLLLSLTSCGADGIDGADGQPGDVYLKIVLGSNVTRYWDNNPYIPTSFNTNYYYEMGGYGNRYDYSYDRTIGDNMATFTGTYTIPYPNPGQSGEEGEDGSLFSDGDDGEDGADGTDVYKTVSFYKESDLETAESMKEYKKIRKY